jgi:hypothetical protein
MIHVYPINDTIDHDTDGGDCVCVPKIEWVDEKTGLPYGEPIAIHHSLDGREKHEK